MDRLSKKCFIASGIVHGTLVLLLAVGPAFLASESKPESLPLMTFIPLVATDSGAYVPPKGNPDAGQQNPQTQLRQPQPPQPPEPPVRPSPPRPEPRDPDTAVRNVTRTDPNSLEVNSNKKPGPQVDLSKVIIRKTPRDAAPKNTSSDAGKANADREKSLKALQQAATAISGGAGKSVGDLGPLGDPRGVGEGSGSFTEILKSIYFNNWREPSDATIEDAVVKVTVTVARDGTVMSSRITKSSGDPAVDRSVQRTLDNVKSIVPFPPSWKESERQFPISFSLKAKRSIG